MQRDDKPPQEDSPLAQRIWKGARIGLIYSAIAPLVFEFELIRESGPSLQGLTPFGWCARIVVWTGNKYGLGFWSIYFISLILGAALGASVAWLTYRKAPGQ